MNFKPLHFLSFFAGYLAQDFFTKTISNATFYDWINKKVELYSAKASIFNCDFSKWLLKPFSEFYFLDQLSGVTNFPKNSIILLLLNE